MPQLDPYWILSQVFWLAISFVVLYLAMVRAGLPRLGSVLHDRRERIADDLESAETARRQSEKLEQENQAQLKNASLRAVEIVSEIQKESDTMAAQRHAELDKVLQKKMADAQTSIDQAKREVLERVVPVSVDLTQAVLKRVAGLEIPRDKIEQAVKGQLRNKHV